MDRLSKALHARHRQRRLGLAQGPRDTALEVLHIGQSADAFTHETRLSFLFSLNGEKTVCKVKVNARDVWRQPTELVQEIRDRLAKEIASEILLSGRLHLRHL